MPKQVKGRERSEASQEQEREEALTLTLGTLAAEQVAIPSPFVC